VAFEAKDGKKSTNRAPMMAHNRSLDRQQDQGAVATADPLEQPGQDQPQSQGDPTEQVMNDFESVMQAVQSGQQPDPQAAKQLVDYFSQFAQEDHSEPAGDEPQFE
jgi:hypothetical protein